MPPSLKNMLHFWGTQPDVALLELLTSYDMPDLRNTVQKVQELPFNSRRKFMATKILNPADNKCTVYVKGAFEKILECSTSHLKQGIENMKTD